VSSPRTKEADQLGGVAPVAHDALARPARRQCRRDDVAGNAERDKPTIPIVAGHARLVAGLDRPLAHQPCATLDDSRRRIVAGVLRSADTEPELREIPNDSQHVRRLWQAGPSICRPVLSV
jgi:hypothetical protein